MDTLKQLKLKRDTLSAQIAAIEKLISQYEAIEQRAHALLSQDIDVANERRSPMLSELVHLDEERPDSRTRSQNADIAAFEEVVRDILRNTEAPVDRATLLEQVIRRGINVGVQDP